MAGVELSGVDGTTAGFDGVVAGVVGVEGEGCWKSVGERGIRVGLFVAGVTGFGFSMLTVGAGGLIVTVLGFFGVAGVAGVVLFAAGFVGVAGLVLFAGFVGVTGLVGFVGFVGLAAGSSGSSSGSVSFGSSALGDCGTIHGAHGLKAGAP